MATAEYLAMRSGVNPRNPAFAPRRKYRDWMTSERVSPEMCPRRCCRDSGYHKVCCYLDALSNRKLWCLRDDQRVTTCTSGPARTDTCLIERPRKGWLARKPDEDR